MNIRELTLKETTTSALLSRLQGLATKQSRLMSDEWEIESIELELEERNEWEQKANRW